MVFPSKEWAVALVAAVNRQPELASALAGLGRDAGFVIEPDPPALREAMAFYGRQEQGRVTVRLLPDPEELWELEPAYVFRGRYRAWKAILQAEDPMAVALQGKVRVEGDLEGLVRHLSHRFVVQRAIAGVPTEFVDGTVHA